MRPWEILIAWSPLKNNTVIAVKEQRIPAPLRGKGVWYSQWNSELGMLSPHVKGPQAQSLHNRQAKTYSKLAYFPMELHKKYTHVENNYFSKVYIYIFFPKKCFLQWVATYCINFCMLGDYILYLWGLKVATHTRKESKTTALLILSVNGEGNESMTE